MMTRKRARRFRVIHNPNHPKPWIVQGSGDRRGDWSDMARFQNQADAYGYAAAIQDNQFAYLERR
jgi:hypothetical protein